jgi:hypothetical protein
MTRLGPEAASVVVGSCLGATKARAVSANHRDRGLTLRPAGHPAAFLCSQSHVLQQYQRSQGEAGREAEAEGRRAP